MKVECPSIPSRLRPGLTLIIAFMVISSPINVMLANPELMAAPFSAPSTLSQDGSDFTTQAALSFLTAKQTNNLVNTVSYYDIIFRTTTTGTIAKVVVDFPAGTSIGSQNLLVEREGIGPGTAVKTGPTQITFTVTNPISVPADTKIRLEYNTIVNPQSPSSIYKVTVTTRDPADAIIDGPTQSKAYPIKQIGTNDIEGSAITGPKIADNTITSTKPAESFMKRVTVLDDAAGHAVGWNPGGVQGFNIFDPSIIDEVQSFPIIVVDSASTVLCAVTDIKPPGLFFIQCNAPPPEGSKLSYIVTSLPAHVIS